MVCGFFWFVNTSFFKLRKVAAKIMFRIEMKTEKKYIVNIERVVCLPQRIMNSLWNDVPEIRHYQLNYRFPRRTYKNITQIDFLRTSVEHVPATFSSFSVKLYRFMLFISRINKTATITDKTLNIVLLSIKVLLGELHYIEYIPRKFLFKIQQTRHL